jgi:hypothetical protein
MIKTHFAPYESTEFIDNELWSNQVKNKELKTFPCIAGWSDICGFGSILERSKWNLQKVKEGGFFEVLSEAYSLLGHPLIVGIPPMPTERVLVINDGIARTTDLINIAHVNQWQMLFYIRNLFMNHSMLERLLVQKKLGLRTVLAGGERCQYSPQKSTGESFLYYTNEPSDFGKALLNQQFVYNPAEFQMNTAFALAYTLESLGSKEKIIPNRVYIEESWLEKLNTVLDEPAFIEGQEIKFLWHGELGISISFDDHIEIVTKGYTAKMFKVSKFVIYPPLEGEKTEFFMSKHDL